MRKIICSLCGTETIVPDHWHHTVCYSCHKLIHELESKGQQSITGFSITLCFGKWGGIYFTMSTASIRLCLGFVAFTIYFRDLEAVISNIQNK